MIVYVNRKHVSGPWGGGNRTIKSLHEALLTRGHTPVYELDENVDIVYCHDPRPNDEGLRYEHFLWLKKNHNIPIFQRVGDVFYHRGEVYTKYLKETLFHSDQISYITPWAAKFLGQQVDNKKHLVHELRPPASFFIDKLKKTNEKVKIITHHWSTNPLKGFDFYMMIDKLIENYENVDFYYLGRRPDDFLPKNIKILKVEDEQGVISHLSDSDIYVTASKFETGGNHVVEAMACKLPVLYHLEGGGICDLSKNNGYGYSSIEEFDHQLTKLISLLSKNETTFPNLEGTLEDVCLEYVKCMENLVEAKD